MKKIYISLLIVGVVFLQSCETKKNSNIPTIEKPYLGQTPPGLTPVPFAPGLVSTDIYEYDGAFASDMKAFYFIRRGEENVKSTFYEYKYNEADASWKKSVLASPWIGRPVISPDGNTMHLGTRYLKKTDTGWSKIQNLDPPIVSNDSMYIMRLSEAANGTYYFDEASESGPMRYSRLINGKREKPQELEIDVGNWNAHPFIAPDDSYILWDGEKDIGFGGNDLYISFKQPNGLWGEAINLGDKINTSGEEGGAYVTPDGKYLFFNRGRGAEKKGMYWVDAQIIETLRNESLNKN